jgi:hypothetical protein
MNSNSMLLTIILIIATDRMAAQPGSMMPSEPGKCYAKCYIKPKYGLKDMLLPRYTGANTDTLVNTNITALRFTPQAAGTKWVKKKADKNCLSANPDDCLVWCLVDVPATPSIAYFVKDTMLTKEYVWEVFPVMRLISRGGYTEWKDVPCDGDVTPTMLKKLQKALMKEDLYLGEIDGKMSQSLKDALNKYQSQNHLFEGAITYETLKSLKISSR